MVGAVVEYLRASREPPAVYSGDDRRHATWLELFFDLVYVVAIAELGLLLHENLTRRGFLTFAGLFLLVWWTWLGFTEYADAFDTDDSVHRIGMTAVMLGVVVLTGTIHDVLRGGSLAFTAAYLALSLLSIGMYLRAWLAIPEYRGFLRYVLAANAAGALVWATALVVPEPGRFAVWGLSFLVSVLVVAAFVRVEEIPRRTSHFPERLGLFTILVLGETILAVAVGASGTDWTVGPAVTAISGFVVAVAIWWLYFGQLDEEFLTMAFRAEDRDTWSRIRERSVAHVLGHFVVYVGIVTTGVGVAASIEASASAHALHAGEIGAVTGGLSLFLVGAAFVHRTTLEPLHDRPFRVRLLGGAVLAVLGLVTTTAAPATFVALVAVFLVGVALLENVVLYRASTGD